MDDSCSECGRPYGKRRRCYTCQPGGRSSNPLQDRTCQVCGVHFLWRPAKSNPASKGLYCSKACSNGVYKSKRHRRGQENPNWKGGHVTKRDGYRMVVAPDGRQRAEHRVLMEAHIGRRLLPHETVHHRNGDKLDNRIENLELWSSRHPPGQRVEDLVAFAREILELYG